MHLAPLISVISGQLEDDNVKVCAIWNPDYS